MATDEVSKDDEIMDDFESYKATLELDRLEALKPKQHIESYIWNAYSPAPTDELSRMTKNCMSLIKKQPFFGEMPVGGVLKCEKCKSNHNRLNNIVEPITCRNCFYDPSLFDNFELMEKKQ